MRFRSLDGGCGARAANRASARRRRLVSTYIRNSDRMLHDGRRSIIAFVFRSRSSIKYGRLALAALLESPSATSMRSQTIATCVGWGLALVLASLPFELY